MDATTQEKQQYLRVNILESGYDAEDFIEFMHQNTSEDTPDMNELSLETIQHIVKLFKQKKGFPQQNLQQQPINTSKQSKKENTSDVNNILQNSRKLRNIEEKKNKIIYQKYQPHFDYEFDGIVKCVESEKLFSQNKLIIDITNMETKETEGYIFGLGAKTQYYYTIKTNISKQQVRRNSDDFDWLNTTLHRLYPNILLPQLEQVRRDAKDPYLKRKKDIQLYLKHLAHKPYLHNSQVFIDFITLSFEKMEKYKKSFDSIGFAKGVYLVKNIKGEAEVELSNNLINFYKNSKIFTKNTAQIHQKLSLAIAKMSQSIRTAVSDTYTVVDLYAQLYDNYSVMTNKFPPFKQEQYSDILINLNNFFLGIGDNFKGSINLIDKHIKQYYRFMDGYDRSLSRIQKQIKQSEVQYLDFKYNLHRKKERVISDPTKWDISSRDLDVKKLSKDQLMQMILPKQALTENQHKLWYAYSLLNYKKQFQFYLDISTKRYKSVFSFLARDLLVNNKAYVETLSKFYNQENK